MPIAKIALWNVLRVASFGFICRSFHQRIRIMPRFQQRKKLALLLALVPGTISYKLCSYTLDNISSKVWSMERTSSTDDFFIQNGRKGGQDSHVLVCYKINRLPFEKIKQFARDHFGKFKRCRVVLDTAFG